MRVTYEDAPAAEAWWFEVDGAYSAEVSGSGNPWLACAVPLAVSLGQPLRIEAPVDPDPAMLAGVRELMRLWEYGLGR